MSFKGFCQCPPTPNKNHPQRNVPGLGIEFESQMILLRVCDIRNQAKPRDSLKGKPLGRSGELWELTADDTLDMPESVCAEYVLNGLKAKLGTGLVGRGASEIAEDLVSPRSILECICQLIRQQVAWWSSAAADESGSSSLFANELGIRFEVTMPKP